MTKIVFQTIWKPPKSRNVKLLVLGTIPELSSIALHKVKWVEAFQRGYDKVYAQFLERVENPYAIDFEEDDDEFTLEEYLELNSMSDSDRVERFLEKRFEVLEPDPEDVRVENLWQSRPVSVRSVTPGQMFSYIYMAWNCETNRMWSCEKFPEARKIQIPLLAKDPKGEDTYVASSAGFDTKQGETLKFVQPSVPTLPSGGPAMSDDDDWDD